MREDMRVLQSLAPAAVASTTTGTAVDTAGFRSCVILFDVGEWTDGSHLCSVEASADADSWAEAYGDGDAAPVIDGAGDDNAPYSCEYNGPLRYVRPVITVTSGTTGCVIGCTAILMDAIQRPAVSITLIEHEAGRVHRPTLEAST